MGSIIIKHLFKVIVALMAPQAVSGNKFAFFSKAHGP